MNLKLHDYWHKYPKNIQWQLSWLQSGQAFKTKTKALAAFCFLACLVAVIGLLVFQSLWLFVFSGLSVGFVLWLTGLGVHQSFRHRARQEALQVLQSPTKPEQGVLHVALHPFEALDRCTSGDGSLFVHFVPFAKRIQAELELRDGTRFVFALDPLMKEIQYEAGNHEVDVYRVSQSAMPVLLVSPTQVIYPYTVMTHQ